jgi:hypothetical protein
LLAGLGNGNGDGIFEFYCSGAIDDFSGQPCLAAGACVVFGRPNTNAVIVLGAVFLGSGGFALKSNYTGKNGHAGVSKTIDNAYSLGGIVFSAGDVNGDGLADLLVASPFYGGGFNGRVYVLFGSTTGTVATSSYVDQFGTSGNDIITGTSAGQTLVGGNGNDVITGFGGG